MATHHGEKLKKYLRESDISITDLASKIGLKRGAIYYMFGIPNFDEDVLKKLEKGGINTKDLFGQTSNVPHGTSENIDYTFEVMKAQQQVIESQREIIKRLEKDLTEAKEKLEKQNNHVKKLTPHHKKADT